MLIFIDTLSVIISDGSIYVQNEKPFTSFYKNVTQNNTNDNSGDSAGSNCQL